MALKGKVASKDPVLEALYNQGLGIRGDTYDIKDQLKALGCKWYADVRCWVAPNAHQLALAFQLCAQAGIKVIASRQVVGVPTLAQALKGASPKFADVTNDELFKELEHRGVGVFELTRETLGEALALADDQADFDFLEDPS